ncbi:hypothetical protein CLBKND_01137 [Methylorubrum aminovorans]
MASGSMSDLRMGRAPCSGALMPIPSGSVQARRSLRIRPGAAADPGEDLIALYDRLLAP